VNVILSDEDVATVPGPSTPYRNCVKAKDPPPSPPIEEEEEEGAEAEGEEVIPPTKEEKSLMMKAFANMSCTSNDVLSNPVLADKLVTVIKCKFKDGAVSCYPIPQRSLRKLADDKERNRNSEHLGLQWQSAPYCKLGKKSSPGCRLQGVW